MGENENLGFYLINYAKNTVKLTNSSVLVLNEYVSQEIGDVFTSKYKSFDFYLWHFKELWLNFKIHSFFFNKVLSNACCKKRKIEQLQAFKTRLGMGDIMSHYMLVQSLVLILR